MTTQLDTNRGTATRSASRALALLALGGAVSLSACDSLLQVTNPNNANESSLSDPIAAASEVTGEQNDVIRAIGGINGSYMAAVDEAVNAGSRDDFLSLDRGAVSNINNEYTNNSFLYAGEARWLGWKTVQRMQSFDASGALTDRSQLAKAQLYAALVYNTIANTYDDFALSNRDTAVKNLGPANMSQMYDSAQAYLDAARVVLTRGRTATETAALTALQPQILALSARNKFDKAVWKLLNPSGQTPANPLVNDAGANADAAAALAQGFGDKVTWTATVTSLLSGPSSSFGSSIKTGGYTKLDPVLDTLTDPISRTKDPFVKAAVDSFTASQNNTPLTFTSGREMLLQLAEAALAQGNTGDFATYINRVRDIYGLPHWTGGAGQPSARDMLIHERRVALLFSLRRLNDLYRFGLTVYNWAPNEGAAKCPGLLFPITITERQANPLITPQTPGANGVLGCGQ